MGLNASAGTVIKTDLPAGVAGKLLINSGKIMATAVHDTKGKLIDVIA